MIIYLLMLLTNVYLLSIAVWGYLSGKALHFYSETQYYYVNSGANVTPTHNYARS
jgi:hypothetical protein